MKKTIGILAHVDAGKTTFAEQILYHTKSIKVRGRVDHRDSFLDSHDIEKQRGITVFSDQAVFNYNSSTYYLVDTPGHADFCSEMERTIKVMDYAVLLVSAVEGVQSQTEIIWQLLKKHKIPVFFFINKIDRVGADIKKVFDEIRLSMTDDICFIDDLYDNNKVNDNIMEFVAEHDEKSMELYINEEYEKDLWIDSIKKLIRQRRFFPCLCGSALQDQGIDDFIDKFDMLTYTEYDSTSEFSGIVYKIKHDEHENRLCFIKALSGTLNIKDQIRTGIAETHVYQKISDLRIYNGSKFKNVGTVSAGDIFAVQGLHDVLTGEGIGSLDKETEYMLTPALRSKVIFDGSLNPMDVLKCFKILDDEDPALNVKWDQNFKEIQVSIMGVIQLEVLKEIVSERFGIDVEFGPCEILYKETITGTATGYGHFEPLRHYAEVHLKLEPGQRNSGITFHNECSTDDLNVGTQNLIHTHIFEREHHGILTGSPVTDLKITLLTGRSSNKHTSGGDFREATFRALRQGLESTDNILLEPYYKFKIEADVDYSGRIISDIQKMNGTFDAPKMVKNKCIITGRGPVSTFIDYSVELTSFTKGKGKINYMFDGYDRCHNEREIIDKFGYSKDADIEYTSSSVFCAKGESFIVKGCDAEDYMHCLK